MNAFVSSSTDYSKLATSSYQRQLAKDFFDLDIHKFNDLLKRKTERYWQRLGEEKALNLFHQAAKHVPAYKHFLKKHGVTHTKIHTAEDFLQVPVTSKETYIQKYSLEDLSWHGELSSANIVSFSSGSSGTPYLWPRSTYQDFEGAFQFEHLLTSLFKIESYSTLLVNCFSMGNYVAGTYVLGSTKLVAQKGYPLTVISPGINYDDIFSILNQLYDKFEQIILCGYPPFLRNVIDIGNENGFNFSKLNLKFFFASEFFSENWRDYTLSLTGSRSSLYDSTNIYGSADSAIFCFETPLAILIRRISQHDDVLSKELFGTPFSPTLSQYNPALTYFESIDGRLVLTSASGLPLVRYDLKDEGATFSLRHVKKCLDSRDVNLDDQIVQNGLKDNYNNLPFVYLTSRSDHAVSFYAIMIFPQYIRLGLEARSLRTQVSGRFSMKTSYDESHNPILEIHVELNPDVNFSTSLKSKILKKLVQALRTHCSEYSFLEKSIGTRALPRLTLYTNRSGAYFGPTVKQQWIIHE